MPAMPDPQIDYQAIASRLEETSGQEAYSLIVDAPFENTVSTTLLFLGFICMYLEDSTTGKIQLVGQSQTEQYELSVEKVNFNPEDYQLDVIDDKDNAIVKAVQSNSIQTTTDWADFCRKSTPVETARFNQANSGIAYTAVYPLSGEQKGSLMFNFYQYQDNLGPEQANFMKTYTDIVSDFLEKQTTATPVGA